jgi:hypothetical protein
MVDAVGGIPAPDGTSGRIRCSTISAFKGRPAENLEIASVDVGVLFGIWCGPVEKEPVPNFDSFEIKVCGKMEIGNRAKIGAYVMFGALSLILLLTGIKLPGTAMRVLSSVPLVITLLFYGYDNWLWRCPGIILLAKRPSLVGTWYGDLTSYRVDADTHNPVTTKLNVVVTVAQSFTNTTVILMTTQSSSRSITAEFVRDEPDSYALFYTYDNTPKLGERDKLVLHRGCTVLTVQGLAPREFTAEYWTNRETKGTFSARRVSKSRVTDFAAGQRLGEAAQNTDAK